MHAFSGIGYVNHVYMFYSLVTSFFNNYDFIGQPNKCPDHPDYIPSIFTVYEAEESGSAPARSKSARQRKRGILTTATATFSVAQDQLASEYIGTFLFTKSDIEV